ncbi:MAG: NADH-quinone oxidoreductase subunit B, partial [Planctomycetota bacterium]
MELTKADYAPHTTRRDDVLVTKLQAIVDFFRARGVNWARRNSLWPMPFATACCGIELMAMGASRYDIGRFGAEAMRFTPRQCDLLICAGRVVIKMMPVIQRLYQQMCEPKW